MDEELVNINKDLNKEKFFVFCKKNKNKIIIFFLICFIIFFSFVFYKYSLNTKRSKLAENYIRALQTQKPLRKISNIIAKKVADDLDQYYRNYKYLDALKLILDKEESDYAK